MVNICIILVVILIPNKRRRKSNSQWMLLGSQRFPIILHEEEHGLSLVVFNFCIELFRTVAWKFAKVWIRYVHDNFGNWLHFGFITLTNIVITSS